MIRAWIGERSSGFAPKLKLRESPPAEEDVYEGVVLWMLPGTGILDGEEPVEVEVIEYYHYDDIFVHRVDDGANLYCSLTDLRQSALPQNTRRTLSRTLTPPTPHFGLSSLNEPIYHEYDEDSSYPYSARSMVSKDNALNDAEEPMLEVQERETHTLSAHLKGASISDCESVAEVITDECTEFFKSEGSPFGLVALEAVTSARPLSHITECFTEVSLTLTVALMVQASGARWLTVACRSTPRATRIRATQTTAGSSLLGL